MCRAVHTHSIHTHLKTKEKASFRRELLNPPSFPSAFPTPSSNHALLLLMYEKVPCVIWVQRNLPSKYRVLPNDFILTSWHRTPKLTYFTNGQGFPQCLSLQYIARLVGNGQLTKTSTLAGSLCGFSIYIWSIQHYCSLVLEVGSRWTERWNFLKGTQFIGKILKS